MIHHVIGDPFNNCVVHDHHDIMIPCTSNFVIFDREIILAFRNNFQDGYAAFNRLRNEDIIFANTVIYVTDNNTGIRFFPLIVPQSTTENCSSNNMRFTNFMVNQLDDYFGRSMRSRIVDIPYFHTYYSWERIIVPQLQKYNNSINAEIFLFDRMIFNNREISREVYENRDKEKYEVDITPWNEKITREDLWRIESFHLMKKQHEEEEEIRLDF